MEIFIYTFHVLERHFLPQHHLIKRSDKERIEEATVEDS